VSAPILAWPTIADMVLGNFNSYVDIRDYGACRACGIYARLHAAAGSTRPLLCSRCATETWRLRIRPPRWASLGPVLLAAAGLEVRP
jgi:hypothetical protein